MLKKERQAYIIQQINRHNKVLSSDLSNELLVSEDTIRRDLLELDRFGKLTKVHGGALSKSSHFTIQNNIVYSLNEKKVIARKAATLVKDGMFVVLSGGTTIRELIKALPLELNATFITPSIPTALELMEHPNIEVIFVGNKLSKSAQIAVGSEVTMRLNDVRANLCFLGTNSIDIKGGVTDLDWEVIEVKRAMIACSKTVVSLTISEKLDTVQHLKVCNIAAIDVLVTELDTTHQLLKKYKENMRNIL